MKKKLYTLAIIFLFGIQAQAQSELYIDISISAEQMVEDFFDGICVDISNVTYIGDNHSKGYFEGANAGIGLPGGILMSSGHVIDAIGPNNSNSTSSPTSGVDDPDLNNISNGVVNDAAVLEFDLISEVDDTLYFSYIFASEEYPEYTCSQFNDVFGFFVTGPNPSGGNYIAENMALIPDTLDPSGLTFTDLPVTINNVNSGEVGAIGSISNCTPPYGSLDFSVYYISNIDGEHIEYDGMTTELLAPLAVIAGESYHIKIAVADVGDAAFDSSVFLGVESLCGDSLITPPAEVQISIDGNTVSVLNESRYATDYFWDFGDNTTSTERYPGPHTYAQDGYYSVSLITQNYCCSDTFLMTIPVGDILDIDANSCDVDYFELNALSPGPGQAGIWSIILGSGMLADASNPNSVLNNPSIGINMMEWRITETSSGNLIFIDTFVVNVSELPQVSIITDLEGFCENDTAVQLDGFPSGGQFEGGGVTGNIFDPLMAGIGVHLISYNYNDENGCFNSATESLEVWALPDVIITTGLESFCENDAAVQLEGLPTGGLFEGAGVIGNSFDPEIAGAGNHVISYSYMDGNGCNNSITESIDIWASPDVIITTNLESFCENDAAVQLEGSPFGGLFEGAGVVGDFFDPAVAGFGNHIVTYSFTDDNGCANNAIVSTEIIAVPATPEIILIGGDSLICSVTGDNYLWELDGMPLNSNSQQILLDGDGNYTVTVIQSGCTSEPSEAFLFTGISTIFNNKTYTLNVFPNPAKETIQIQLSERRLIQNPESVKIFNSQGQIVSQFFWSLQNTNKEADISKLPSGVYFVQVINGEVYYSGNFIKL